MVWVGIRYQYFLKSPQEIAMYNCLRTRLDE